MNNMTFEAEYLLLEFRTKVQPSLFDLKGNRYNNNIVSDRQAVIMLELINLLESEINKLERNERNDM